MCGKCWGHDGNARGWIVVSVESHKTWHLPHMCRTRGPPPSSSKCKGVEMALSPWPQHTMHVLGITPQVHASQVGAPCSMLLPQPRQEDVRPTMVFMMSRMEKKGGGIT